MHTLPGYRGTYIRGYVLSGHCNQQQISVKLKGYLFSEGYLFTGFYGSFGVNRGLFEGVFSDHKTQYFSFIIILVVVFLEIKFVAICLSLRFSSVCCDFFHCLCSSACSACWPKVCWNRASLRSSSLHPPLPPSSSLFLSFSLSLFLSLTHSLTLSLSLSLFLSLTLSLSLSVTYSLSLWTVYVWAIYEPSFLLPFCFCADSKLLFSFVSWPICIAIASHIFEVNFYRFCRTWYSKIGFRRMQGLETQPEGVLIFQKPTFLFLFHLPDERYVRTSRKRRHVRIRTKSVETCALVAENATRCTCELRRRSNVEAEAPGTGLVVRAYAHSWKFFLSRKFQRGMLLNLGNFLARVFFETKLYCSWSLGRCESVMLTIMLHRTIPHEEWLLVHLSLLK